MKKKPQWEQILGPELADFSLLSAKIAALENGRHALDGRSVFKMRFKEMKLLAFNP